MWSGAALFRARAAGAHRLAQTASLGRWANCKRTSRAGMSGVVSRWLGSVEGLPEIAERLLRVQIENRPALDVIRLYDSPDSCSTAIPPYFTPTAAIIMPMASRWTKRSTVSWRRCSASYQARLAVSGYRCELMENSIAGWAPRTMLNQAMSFNKKHCGKESLWMNY